MRVLPVWMLFNAAVGSGTRRFCSRRSYTDAVAKWPPSADWYLTPASHCLPRSGLYSSGTAPSGVLRVVLATGVNDSL